MTLTRRIARATFGYRGGEGGVAGVGIIDATISGELEGIVSGGPLQAVAGGENLETALGGEIETGIFAGTIEAVFHRDIVTEIKS